MNKHNISFLAFGGLAHSNRITRWGRSDSGLLFGPPCISQRPKTANIKFDKL